MPKPHETKSNQTKSSFFSPPTINVPTDNDGFVCTPPGTPIQTPPGTPPTQEPSQSPELESDVRPRTNSAP